MSRAERTQVAIGLVTPALAAYWSQLPGARQEVEKNNLAVAGKLADLGDVANFGICDSVARGREIADAIRSRSVDVLVIHVGTYSVSKNILPILRRIDIPVISLHLQPVSGFPEKSSSDVTIPRNSFSMAGELGALASRAGARVHPVAGLLHGDERCWREVGEWIDAVRVKKRLESANVALVGSVYNGMSDINVDATRLMARFGLNCEFLEMADIRGFYEDVEPEDANRLYEQIAARFEMCEMCTRGNLALPLRVALALERFVDHFNLHAVAFHGAGYPDTAEERIGYSITLGGSLLAERSTPFIAEGDLGLSVPMMIFKLLGYGASQTEVNVADFDRGLVFLSHSGPADLSMAHGKPSLQWLSYFHGRSGSGVSCSFGFRPEPVTVMSLGTDSAGEFRFVATEGVVREGARLQNGNVNSGVDFGRPIHEFVESWTVHGPTHHSVIGYGRRIAQLTKIVDVLGVELVRV